MSLVAEAARDHCGADGIALRMVGGTEVTYRMSQSRGDGSARTSLTVPTLQSDPIDGPTLTVSWNGAHPVTEADRLFLESLGHATLLALRTLSDAGVMESDRLYRPHERQLFFEFQRQVRSLLAIVRAVVRRMAEHPCSVEDFAAHLEGRLGALARIQGFLLRTPHARVDLEELVRAEFLAQSVPEEQLQIDGPRVLLGAREAGTVGLVMHELTTNAVKFGALAAREGHIQVSWRHHACAPSGTILDWKERAASARPPCHHRGFGFELIENALPYELDGFSSIVVEPSGLQCTFAFALPGAEDA